MAKINSAAYRDGRKHFEEGWSLREMVDDLIAAGDADDDNEIEQSFSAIVGFIDGAVDALREARER